MSRTIWWIRHGETDWNREGRWQGHSDVPLGAEGRAQAARLRERLLHSQFDGVFSSDLSRAQETARLALPEVTPQVDGRLREVHFGQFEGKTRTELSDSEVEELRLWLESPFDRHPPAGESLEQLAQRVESWMAELPESGIFAVFTHGGVIRAMIWRIVGVPVANRWTVQINNTSTTCISYGPRTTLEWVNDCSHLYVS